MYFNYERKKFIIKINKYNANREKDKINLISIGKTNFLKYNNKEKKYFKIIYERNISNKKKLNYLENNLLKIIIN